MNVTAVNILIKQKYLTKHKMLTNFFIVVLTQQLLRKANLSKKLAFNCYPERSHRQTQKKCILNNPFSKTIQIFLIILLLQINIALICMAIGFYVNISLKTKNNYE